MDSIESIETSNDGDRNLCGQSVVIYYIIQGRLISVLALRPTNLYKKSARRRLERGRQPHRSIPEA
jgi:hypothetical protein